MEKQRVWREELLVKSYDVDCTGRLNLQSLLSYFQEIAGNHATHLGVGYEDLRQRGLFWVLSRIKIRISRMPAWSEVISLATWPKGVDKLFALRDFRMLDVHNNTLVTATTAWLLLDRERNRPQRMDVLPVDIYDFEADHAISDVLDKLKHEYVLAPHHERRIMVSDLDVNYHVNNAEYVKWIIDSFDIDQMRTRAIHSIQVNYLDEAVFGDTVALWTGGKDDSYYVEGVAMSRASKVFQAKLIWQ
jgi:medium-chain acyl-[acyl-carrier-protein] hydrolase